MLAWRLGSNCGFCVASALFDWLAVAAFFPQFSKIQKNTGPATEISYAQAPASICIATVVTS